MRHIIPISGKDSLATALLQTARHPEFKYEFIFNDTGAELPETYRWLEKVEKKTGWNVERIGKSLEDIIDKYNGFLPSSKGRYCTREAKIQPMEAWLKSSDEPVIVYYGLRADEQRTGYVPVADSAITPAYPLRDLGIDLTGVWSILTAQDLLPPAFAWERLREAVEARGNTSVLSPVEDHFLFSGRTRANCYFCFYQRQSELLWLLETHPDLYRRMSEFEKADYTWIKGVRLSEFEGDKALHKKIFDRKVVECLKYIVQKYQMKLPGLNADNEIALTSCGLLCGK